MEKNGFTLVELMVVVIVIGILAAVSMPKFQIAADKTKAAEVPQILNSIAGAQEQYKHAHDGYLLLPPSSDYNFATGQPAASAAQWKKVGLQIPESKYFNYEVSDIKAATIDENDPLKDNKPEFTAKATLRINLTRAKKGDTVTINQDGPQKDSSSKNLKELISSFFP